MCPCFGRGVVTFSTGTFDGTTPSLDPPVYNAPQGDRVRAFLGVISPRTPIGDLSPTSSPLFETANAVQGHQGAQEGAMKGSEPIAFGHCVLFHVIIRFIKTVTYTVRVFRRRA